MAHLESLGIKKLEAIHYYVHDLQRSRKFYCDDMDFAELACSGPALEEQGKQRSVVFAAGEVTVVCSQPLAATARAQRYRNKHPDGIGSLVFEVQDIERSFKLLEERGAAIIDDIFTHEESGGTFRTFSITTPLGDTTFRFVERSNHAPLFPGLIYADRPKGGDNRYRFGGFDHVTSNFQTMKPALLWFEHVMGFESYWRIEFHTADVVEKRDTGSGLRSQVMWDPDSGLRFANNEPVRPFFKQSQINIFGEQHRGDGVQHVALTVADIMRTVEGLRKTRVEFMPTPGTYYDVLPERLQRIGVGAIDEDIEKLRSLGVLVDGEKKGAYLLQIFLQDAATLYHEDDAGPFFYEIIQRKGDRGFGAGNFRALFESIELQQRHDGLVP